MRNNYDDDDDDDDDNNNNNNTCRTTNLNINFIIYNSVNTT